MPPINYDKLISRFEASQKKANKANEKRYGELLDVIRNLQTQSGETFASMQDLYGQFGQRAEREAQQQGTRQLAQSEQNLISRGLGNTTIRGGARRDIQQRTQDQLADISERVAAQKAGVLGQKVGADIQTGGMLARAIEGRSDVGPNLSQYASLLQRAAAAGDPNQKVTARVAPSGISASPSAGGGGGGGYGASNSNLSGMFVQGGGGAPGSPADTITNPNARSSESSALTRLQAGKLGDTAETVKRKPGKKAGAFADTSRPPGWMTGYGILG